MKKPSKTKIYIGTSNVVLPGPKKSFPEDHQSKTRLGYYATLFNTVEINSTFYKIPKKTTLEKWCMEVPDQFKFTVKLWREITHQKNLKYNDKDVLNFMDVVGGIDKKKGCLLVQFPGKITSGYHQQIELLLSKIADLNTAPQWQVAVEFRHESWYHQQETYSMLRQHNAVIVYQDIPKSKTPFTPSPGNVVYLRFHGPTGTYRDGYTNEVLASYEQRIRQWQKQGKEIYVYFNNTMGPAFDNSRTLIEMTDALNNSG